MTSLPSSGSPRSRGSGASGPPGRAGPPAPRRSTMRRVPARVDGDEGTDCDRAGHRGAHAHRRRWCRGGRRGTRRARAVRRRPERAPRTAARRSTATWIPDPPQAQPGGPAPRHDTLWLVPGTVSARSARSGRATARSRARIRAAAARRMRSGSSWSAAPDIAPTPAILRTPFTAADQAGDVRGRQLAGQPAADPPARGDVAERLRARHAVAEGQHQPPVGGQPRGVDQVAGRAAVQARHLVPAHAADADDQAVGDGAVGGHVPGDRPGEHGRAAAERDRSRGWSSRAGWGRRCRSPRRG